MLCVATKRRLLNNGYIPSALFPCTSIEFNVYITDTIVNILAHILSSK